MIKPSLCNSTGGVDCFTTFVQPKYFTTISGNLVGVSSPDRYTFSVNKGRLTKGSEIKIKGALSGRYRGVVGVNLLADSGDTVCRIALR